jgi:hypothetical protein
VFVGGIECIADLSRDRQHFVEWDRSSLDAIGDRRAFDEFEDKRVNGPAEAGPHVCGSLDGPSTLGPYAVSTIGLVGADFGRPMLEPVDRRDVRMIERGEQLRLALKARESIVVRRERIGQNLDRHVALEPRIAGAIDLL